MKGIEMTNQKGAGMVTILMWVIVVLIGLLGVMKILPAHLEFHTAMKIANDAVTNVATNGGEGIAGIRTDFMKRGTIENVAKYGEEAKIVNEGGKAVIYLEYDNRIPLFANVSLVIHFAGKTN